MKIGHLCHQKLGLDWPSSKICSQKISRFGWRVLSISKCSISASFESCALRFRRVINTGWNFCILGVSNQNVNFRTLTIIVLHHAVIDFKILYLGEFWELWPQISQSNQSKVPFLCSKLQKITLVWVPCESESPINSHNSDNSSR